MVLVTTICGCKKPYAALLCGKSCICNISGTLGLLSFLQVKKISRLVLIGLSTGNTIGSDTFAPVDLIPLHRCHLIPLHRS